MPEARYTVQSAVKQNRTGSLASSLLNSKVYPFTNANDSSGNGHLAMTVRRHGS